MRIGLDLDGVIVNSIPAWIALMNRGAGTSFTLDELPETYGTPVLGAFCDEHQIEMLMLPRPVDGAPEAVARLADGGHDLVVITARAARIRRMTEGWLDWYGFPTIGEMHFLEGRSKVASALQAGIHLMVEDAPNNALALAGAGIPVLLFGAPYNAKLQHPLIHRCDGWAEVLEQIERRSALSA
ncbi:MAG TPA: hypothetical protein VGK74_04085 [Symbiobacteriaceae bacterium]